MRSINLMAFLLIAFSVLAQDAQTNQEKYWKYRERQNNYVLVGDCQGCSLPNGSRSGDDTLRYNDQTGEQGYYIATLAMEYKLRLDHGQPVADVGRELFYAIESLNRLDYYAEYWWEYYYNQNPTPTGVLNGFLIRDDVPADFCNRIVDGNLVENHFNRSIFPTDYGNGAHHVTSGFTRGPHIDCSNLNPLGPEEMSQDHAIAILAGLAVVVKCLPANASFNSMNFMDGQSYYAQEAKNIAYRIVSYAKDGDPTVFDRDWLYINPVTHFTVQGIEWKECIPPGIIDLGVRNVGGASFRLLSYGFAMCAAQIINDFDEASADSYFQSQFAGGLNMVNSRDNFINFWRNHPPAQKNEDYKVLLLAAVSNMWDEDTEDILGERFDAEYPDGAEVHVPQAILLNNMLYGNAMTVPNSVWECMLNSAPCTDMAMNSQNFEWSHGHGRFLYGPNVPHYYYGDQQSGLAYLYFFNAYNIANPAYLGGNYAILNGVQVLNTNITVSPYSSFTENDHKNYFAVNEVRTQNSYAITNDSDPAQIYAAPLDAASVTFAAGQSVVLNPGFQVTLGSNFHAYIDPNFSSISCEFQNNSAVCTNCVVGHGETNPGTQYGTVGVLIEPTENTECLVAHGSHIFKVDLSHAQGSTMFGIGEADDCESFPCMAGCPGDHRYSVKGYYNFSVETQVVGVVYTGDYTFIALNGGPNESRVLKIQGTGLDGPNLLDAANDPNSGEIISGGNTLIGQQTFPDDIEKVYFFDSNLMLVMNNRLVKIGPTTLTNANGIEMFDFTYAPNNDITWGQTSVFDCGDEKFTEMEITTCAFIDEYLFVCGRDGVLERGKILKINGLGESGNDMLHVVDNPTNSNNAFDGVMGHPTYAGDEYFHDNGFQSYVTRMTQINQELLISFRNGSILKLSGTGGNGHDMFNVDYTGFGYATSNVASPTYVIGYQQFENGVWCTDIDFFGGSTFISCYDGKILKVSGTGGSGSNMFNVTANSGYGFSVADPQITVYMQGCEDFAMSVTEFNIIFNRILLSLNPGVLIHLTGSGSGNNMFALAYQDENSFKSQCGYFYFEGCEDFSDLCSDGGNRIAHFEDTTSQAKENDLMIYPNPVSDVLNVKLYLVGDTPFQIEIYSTGGQLVSSQFFEAPQEQIQFDISKLANGLYFVIVKQNELLITERVVINKSQE